jgi:RNA polymerase sigma-70 factor (ECF subfamily)
MPTSPSGKLRVLGAEASDVPALVARCKRGEREALGELYRRYRPEVTRNLVRVLGPQGAPNAGGRGDLEDVVQDVFIEAFRSIPRFRGDSKLSTWLYRICVNVALQRLRKKRRLGEVALPAGGTADGPALAETTSEETPERGLDVRRRLQAVYRILDELAPKKRVVFVLHEIEGREPREIADIVGAPVLTVRTRLHYARKEFYAKAAADPRLDGTHIGGVHGWSAEADATVGDGEEGR